MSVRIILSVIASLLRLLFLLLVTIDPLVRSRESCYNNGTLKIDGKKISCICQHPYTGRYCEDYACVNGLSTGSQYDPNDLFFNKRCLCDPGWTGELCSSSIINRCGDHGSDVDGTCQCKKNFVGDRCQYVTRCINGQLYNGRCACHYGWKGDFCDQIICHQGHADISNRKCICPVKYRGDYCDFCAEPSSSPPPECAEMSSKTIQINGDSVPIILAVIITIILVVLGAAFYFLCYKVSEMNKAAEKARQSKADIENGPPNSGCESCPLNDAVQTQNIDNGLNLDSEKFYDHPPPSYETLTPVEKEQNVLQNAEDKIIAMKRANSSNRNNEDRPEAEIKFSIATPKFEHKTQKSVDEEDTTHHNDISANGLHSESGSQALENTGENFSYQQ